MFFRKYEVKVISEFQFGKPTFLKENYESDQNTPHLEFPCKKISKLYFSCLHFNVAYFRHMVIADVPEK